MTEPLPGSRFRLPVKLSVVAVVYAAVASAVLVLIAPLVADRGPLVRFAVYYAILSPAVVIVYGLTWFIVDRVTTPLIDAYERVAAGDFTAKLPQKTAGSEFIRFRDAFAGMAQALDRSTRALKEADLERRRLFADLAHELATPTSTLLGIAHALRQGEGDTSRLLVLLELETARLERLIADVREVAHLEDPSMAMLVEPCDLGELTTRAVERARLAGVGTCELRCESSPLPVEVDPLRIDQVLANLINNATRHAPGGTVAVTARRDGDDVVLRVEDSGAGVPDELLSQLGRRLLRVDPSRSRDTGGHGLGLSIVRAIVARHDGEVSFGRASLGGLAAEVRLPATAARPAT